MAQLIPNLNSCLSKMTGGEKHFARRLESHLEDDYLCWYDIPVGRVNRYPDFIILHPGRGLLFIEVKDWKLDTIKRMTKVDFDLLTDRGLVTAINPIEQVRQCAYQVVRALECDPVLVQNEGTHTGKLTFPYGYGVVFSNISREQLTTALNGEDGSHLLPEHMTLCKDEFLEGMDAESFQEKLWRMFNYSFRQKLSLPEIDRIRWHLFPEIRTPEQQGELFNPERNDDNQTINSNFPEIIKVMDLHQEQVARNLGNGHRVIHGVAGSGKTMILGFKAVQLVAGLNKPILILCFNISLAARLRHFIEERSLTNKIHVHHFHDWCGQQIKTYNCDLIKGKSPAYERQVTTVIESVEKGLVPRAQYGAVMIDEGHDFEPEWLKLITQMIDPTTDNLLLLYDDAQSIYRKKSGLDFSLSSVGIKARGRTTILKLNYRNTKEILEFAYRFAEEFITALDSDDDHIPIIAPETAGATGPEPHFKQFNSSEDEINYIVACVKKWLSDGSPANEIAVIVPTKTLAQSIAKNLDAASIDNLCLYNQATKAAYKPSEPKVTVLTIHSSKGLEFDRVMLAGIHKIQYVADEIPGQVRLMYVGMTRAKSCLMVTASEATVFTERLVDMAAP